jgi:hypothetical protein
VHNDSGLCWSLSDEELETLVKKLTHFLTMVFLISTINQVTLRENTDDNNGNTGSNPNHPLFDSESLEINHSTLTNVGRDQYHVINNYYVDPNLILGAYNYRRVDSSSMADVLFKKFFPISTGPTSR